VIGVSKPREGDKTEPPEDWEKQIDKGWDYAPGATVSDEVRRLAEAKAASYPERLAKDFLAQAEKVGVVPDEAGLIAKRAAKTEGDAKKWLLAEGKATGCENLVAYDAVTGKEIGRFEGQERNRVPLPEEISRRTHLRGEQLVLLHNHPDSVSLSPDDLLILARPGVKKVTAYGLAGAWFAAENGAEISKLAGVLGAARVELSRQLSLLSARGVNTAGMETHIRNLALARAGIINYTSNLDKTRARLYSRESELIEIAVQEIVFAIKRDPSWN
jgi:hypothetical protein